MMEREPEEQIELWFNDERLERFAASFEQAPSLWHASHEDCDSESPNANAYIHLLDSLGESTDGDAHARLSCAVALCRVFCRLLREKLRWAVGESLVGGTGLEVARALCPHWARRAEHCLRCLPHIFKEEELKIKTPTATPLRRSSTSKEKQAKSPRPVPGLVPLSSPASITPSCKPSQGLLRRVVCGMRRAAVKHGLTWQAAGVVARDIGNVAERVYALWCALRQLVEVKLSALVARGDAPARAGAAQLTYLDWAVADLLMLYDAVSSPVDESSFQQYKKQLALLGTFHLVQRFGLEGPGLEAPPQRWHEAARWYNKTGVVMSPVGLQRRWHEMKQLTRRRLRARLRDGHGAPDLPLHRAVACRYPHVVTEPLRPWRELVAAGLTAMPANERGLTRHYKPPNKKSTENDDLTILKDMDAIASLGGESEASGGRISAPSVRPGHTKHMTANAAAQKPSGRKVSSKCDIERESNNIHDTQGINRNSENTGGFRKTIDVNQEIIDLDTPNTFNKGQEVVGGKTVSKANRSNYSTQIIQQIEKELFAGREISRSSKNRNTTTQNCTNVSNSDDVVGKYTNSSCKMNETESNSYIKNDPNKHPLLSQMLQTVCIFDNDDTFTSYAKKNEQIPKSKLDSSKNTNFHEIKNKSLDSVGSDNRHGKRPSVIMRAVQKQRLEIESLENSQLYNFFDGELSDDSDSVIDLDSHDEVYDGSNDDQEDAGDVKDMESAFDPKLLMYPVVLMTRMENDPSLRILPPPSSNRIITRSPSQIQSPPPSPSSKPLTSSNAITLSPKYPFNEKTRALLKLCKPCMVLLDRSELEGVDRAGGRSLKKVELQDIDEVRRNNRSMLTAQVAPLEKRKRSESSSDTESCDSEWTPEDEIVSSSSKKSTSMKEQKNSDDDLRLLLNDFVGAADGECRGHSKRIKTHGELAATASLAVERGCARCSWRMLCSPPTTAGEAQLQRELLRLAMPQADTATPAPKIAKVPKAVPKRRPSKKRLLSTTKPDRNAALEKQIIPSATAPLPAKAQPDALRTNAGFKVVLAPREPAHPSTALSEENLVPRVGAAMFRPVAVADINRRLGTLVEDPPPPASGAFDPVITSVLSLAPQTNQQRKTPTTEIIKLQCKTGQTAQDLTDISPVSIIVRQNKPASSYDPRPQPDYVVPPSHSGSQPSFHLKTQNCQRSHFERNRPVNMSNSLHPQMHNMTRSMGVTHLPPIRTVDRRTDSQYYAQQEICLGNMLVHPNTQAGDVTQTQGFQNAACSNQGNYAYNQQTSAFQPILHINANQSNPYLIPSMSHPNSFGTAPGFAQTVPLFENSMVPQNTFGSMDASSSQTFFNSMQASESQSRWRSPPAYDVAVSYLAASKQKPMLVDYTQAGTSRVNTSRAGAVAVELDGETTPQAEQYDSSANVGSIYEANENNSFARLDRCLPPLPSHEWVVGHDHASLCVLCADAYHHPWTLLGRFLVLSELEPPPPNAEVWALSPRVRLRLPLEGDNPSKTLRAKREPDEPPAHYDAKPTRLKVKSFARMVSDSQGADDSQDWKRELAPPRLCHDDSMYQKLSEDPLIYAKLLVAVREPSASRALLLRGAPLQLYCLHTCRLHPVHAEPLGPGARFSLSSDEEVMPALQALAQQLGGVARLRPGGRGRLA